MIVTRHRCIFCDENLYRLEDADYILPEGSAHIFPIDCDEQTITCIACNIHYLSCITCSKFCQLLSVYQDDRLLADLEELNMNHVNGSNVSSFIGPDGGNTLKWRCNNCKTEYETCDK